MKRWLSFLAALVFPTLAFGQGAVLQLGGVLKGQPAMFVSNGYVAGIGGYPLANGLAPVDPLTGLLPLGYAWVNSGLGTCGFSGYASTTYSSLCFGFDGSGNGLISLGNSAGGSPTLTIEINGVPYLFPGSGTGNAVMPTSPAIPVGDLLIANGGTNIKDGGVPGLGVPTIAALQALPLTNVPAGTIARVNGYWFEGSAPSVVYSLSTSACSLNAGLGDGGSQIPSNTAGNCWLLSPQTEYNVLNWGATGSTLQNNLTVTGGLSTGTVANLPSDAAVGQKWTCFGCGAAQTLSAPTISTVVNSNGSGSTTYSYIALGIDAAGAPTGASSVVSNSTGPASLNVASSGTAANGETITLTGTYTAAAIYSYNGTSYTFAGTTTGTGYTDYGSASYAATVPVQLPATIASSYAGTADPQFLTIKAITGGPLSASVTFTSPVTTSCSSCIFQHYDSTAINNALAYASPVFLPQGSYNMPTPLAMGMIKGQILHGCGIGCSVINGIGTGNVLSGNTGTSNQEIADLSTSMKDQTAGDCWAANGSPVFRVHHIACDQAFNGIDFSSIGASSFAYVDDVQLTTQVNGAFEIGITATATKTGIEHIAHIATPNSCFQCTGILINGNTPTLDFEYVDIQETPSCVSISNNIGASTPPTYVFFTRLGCNGTWGRAFTAAAGHDIDVGAGSFIQTWTGGGTHVMSASSGVSDFRVTDTIVTGGDLSALTTAATDTSLTGVRVKNTNTAEAAIECITGATNLNIQGGSDTNDTTGATTAQTGIQLDSGCVPGQSPFSGNWLGTQEDMLNNSTLPVSFEGLPMGAKFINDQTSGADTFLVATKLYNSFPTALMQRNGGTSPWSDAVDTAANIHAVLPGTAFVGQQYSFYIKNEGTHTMTLVHDASSTVTIAGTATITAGQMSRFLCVVTAIGGSPTDTCTGNAGS